MRRALQITSISANADGPRDAALRKIDNTVHEYNYQAMSVGRWQIAKQTDNHRLLAVAFGAYAI